MTGDLSDRLAACYTGVLHDAMRAAGHRDFTLPPELRPILPAQAMAGPAFTIEGAVVPDADPHDTLLAWTGLLSQAPTDSLWESQPDDRLVAHMGELSSTLRSKGLRGCVADGLSATELPDGDRLPDLVPGLHAARHRRHWLPKATNVTIRIGMSIAPGDYLVGDRDGLIRIRTAEYRPSSVLQSLPWQPKARSGGRCGPEPIPRKPISASASSNCAPGPPSGGRPRVSLHQSCGMQEPRAWLDSCPGRDRAQTACAMIDSRKGLHNQ